MEHYKSLRVWLKYEDACTDFCDISVGYLIQTGAERFCGKLSGGDVIFMKDISRV